MPIRSTPLASLRTAALALAMVLASCSHSDADATVTIDMETRRQTIDGFGTCLIGWDSHYDRLYATERFQRMYAETVGCSMLRINLWGPVMPVPVEDWRDITYKRFYLAGQGHRASTFLKFAKAVKKINPDIKVIGSVWTPPPWMKFNDSITGAGPGAIDGDSYTRDGQTIDNRVKPELFHHFAKWMVEMVKLHASEGVPLYAVSIGNEVMFTQAFDSCVWTADDYATVVRLLGEMLEAEGLGQVKIFGPETMTGHNWASANPRYVHALMDDPDVARHFDIFATHGYIDGFKADTRGQSYVDLRKIIDRYDRPLWITEGGTGGHRWPEPLRDLGSQLHNALVIGDVSAVFAWQISDREPNEHGLMVFDRMTPKTHVAIHYYRFIRPGAVRVDATAPDGEVMASAFVHDQDQTLTVVLTNPRDEPRQVTLAIEAAPPALTGMRAYRTSATEAVAELEPVEVRHGRMSLSLPAQSIVTLQGATAQAAPRRPIAP